MQASRRFLSTVVRRTVTNKQNVEKVSKSVNKSKGFYDFDKSFTIGGISGTLIGGGVGIYHINKRDDIPDVIFKVTWPPMVGGLGGAIIGISGQFLSL